MPRRIAFAMNAATEDGPGKLKYGERDADRIFQLLLNPEYGQCDPEHSICLKNCESQSQFRSQFIEELLQDWNPRDQLVFYFSGDGIVQNQTYSLKLGLNSTDHEPFDNLIRVLQQYGVSKSILILDACYSGQAVKGNSIGDLVQTQLDDLPAGRAVIASCEFYQESKEHDESKLSVFTHLLTKAIETGLPEKTDKPFLLVEDVMSHVETYLAGPEFEHYQQVPRRKVEQAESSLWISKNIHFDDQFEAQSTDEVEFYLNVHWQLPMIKFPIDPDSLELLQDLLQEYRSAVARLLGCREEVIRANLFFPDPSVAEVGYGYKLFMHKGLRSNMEYELEWDIQFNPNQGATGNGFVSKNPILTFREPELDGEWDYQFQLTDKHIEKIHPDLQWIASIPMVDVSTGESLAVLNVDGLQEVDPQLLKDAIAKTLGFRKAILTAISKLPTITAVFGWSETDD